mgnify:CR=1 FL=1
MAVVEGFLALPHVRKLVPEVRAVGCLCRPSLVVGGARRGFGGLGGEVPDHELAGHLEGIGLGLGAVRPFDAAIHAGQDKGVLGHGRRSLLLERPGGPERGVKPWIAGDQRTWNEPGA